MLEIDQTPRLVEEPLTLPDDEVAPKPYDHTGAAVSSSHILSPSPLPEVVGELLNASITTRATATGDGHSLHGSDEGAVAIDRGGWGSLGVSRPGTERSYFTTTDRASTESAYEDLAHEPESTGGDDERSQLYGGTDWQQPASRQPQSTSFTTDLRRSITHGVSPAGPNLLLTTRGVRTTGRFAFGGASSRRSLVSVSRLSNTQMHDMWLEVEQNSPRRPAGLPRPQAQQVSPTRTPSKMSDKERKEYLAELKRRREEKIKESKPLRFAGSTIATKDDKKKGEKEKPAAVGSVGTGFVYALTCPQGKKYVGKTMRTLTQRTGSGPIDGCKLIREAIKKNGGLGAFKTEVLVCCLSGSLETNERLYIESLQTIYPKGYNERPDGDDTYVEEHKVTKKTSSMMGSNKGTAISADSPGSVFGSLATLAGVPFCTANPKTGKEFLDAAMGGRVEDLAAMFSVNETIIHFRGTGLGQSALHWAAAKGHTKAVKWLLDNGAIIDAKNGNSSTPLHAAAAAGHTEAVLYLLERGASVTERDDDGKSGEQIAESRGHDELAVQLRRRHFAVTDAAAAASNAAAAAAYAAAAATRRDTVPIISPVEKVIAEGLVSLAIAEDIMGAEPQKEVGVKEVAADKQAEKQINKQPEIQANKHADKQPTKNSELEVQLGKVERKLRLDRLYASRPPKIRPRVYS